MTRRMARSSKRSWIEGNLQVVSIDIGGWKRRWNLIPQLDLRHWAGVYGVTMSIRISKPLNHN